MPCSSLTPSVQSLDCLVVHCSLPLPKPSLAQQRATPKIHPAVDSTPQNRWSRMKLSRIWLSWGNSRFLRSLLGVSWVDEQRLGSARVTLFSPSSCSQPATGSAVKCCIIWQSSYGIEYGWSHISNFELEDMILHTNSFRIL